MSTVSSTTFLHRFDASHTTIDLPERFTFPFCYEPHPLTLLAVQKLQTWLNGQPAFSEEKTPMAEGKMFGVLAVRDNTGTLGFLCAYSGKTSMLEEMQVFVPQIVDISSQESFVTKESAVINDINSEIAALEEAEEFSILMQQVEQQKVSYNERITLQQANMAEQKRKRKQEREQGRMALSSEEYAILDKQLNGQSIFLKKQLLALKAELNQQLTDAQIAFDNYQNQINVLKKQRKKLSNRLQKKLFEQYRLLNCAGEEKDVNTIFAEIKEQPPSGTGDCAAPKLLQYAFAHEFEPIALAEFWWGESPKSQIRQHKKYYPACNNKCKPILGHMLSGMTLDDNPLLINTGKDKTIDIVYQDEHLVVINKPEELLSVPGKLVTDSVYTRIKDMFPLADGPLIVHRLDMSTSGLMVLALTKRANKSLQHQFVTRQVEKQYVALLEGQLPAKRGEITLPLCLDVDDRPRQMVSFEHGKPCLTVWELISFDGQFSRVALEPKTGRTHQLRVHCAHKSGFNLPIVGDDLYGTKKERLCLHAQTLSFEHPVTKEKLTFSVSPNF